MHVRITMTIHMFRFTHVAMWYSKMYMYTTFTNICIGVGWRSGLHAWLVMWMSLVRAPSKAPVVSLSKKLYSYCLVLVGSRNQTKTCIHDERYTHYVVYVKLVFYVSFLTIKLGLYINISFPLNTNVAQHSIPNATLVTRATCLSTHHRITFLTYMKSTLNMLA